jgi:simple sugar transport system substrate-binding protein
MRKSLAILAVVALTGAGCGAQNTPAPATGGPAASAAGSAAAAAPGSAAPAAPTAAPAAGAGTTSVIEALWPATVTDTFAALWCKGLTQAGKDFAAAGIQATCVTATASNAYTTPKYVDAINAATAKGDAAIIVFGIDTPGIKDAIAAFEAKGGKVVETNTQSGADDVKTLNALAYVGSSAYDEGFAMGSCLAGAGSKNVLIDDWAPGNPADEGRKKGVEDALKAAGGKTSTIPLDYNSADNAKSQETAALTADPSIDGFANGGSSHYDLETAGIKALNLFGKVRIANADPSPETAAEIQNGHIVCVTSQQGFLQGYESVAVAALNILYGAAPGGTKVIPTGPYVVDKTNVTQLLPLINGTGF